MKRVIYPLVFMTLLGLYGCDEPEFTEPTKEVSTDLSWWLVDWASEASVADTIAIDAELNRLFLFTSYVDEEGHLYQTEQSKELIDTVFSSKSINDKPIYLTLVNDRFVGDTVTQKDPNVITSMLQNPNLEEVYWDQVFDVLDQHPFAGVELDFEKIPVTSFNEYTAFLERARERLKENEMALRVVLEPSVSFQDIHLPSGIEYVVMAYNVHGFHTPDEPGPKATYAFFDQLHEQLGQRHDWTIALATGGFRFKEGTVTSLTEMDAQSMIPKGTTVVRDPNSSVLHATFIEDGVSTSIWWADGQTIKDWMDYWEQTYDYHKFSLWRAGEWSDDSLKAISR
ncbi:hypothetical protein [Exiguobacterium sp. s6]|uniref:hypothetical protein n=1 Tax=Exiguobacterium sp. s6 TaxID=2751236 RepID=UPI001BEC28C3|nr:hypothetical protein [Exiguobacterium sp. s6]